MPHILRSTVPTPIVAGLAVATPAPVLVTGSAAGTQQAGPYTVVDSVTAPSHQRASSEGTESK